MQNKNNIKTGQGGHFNNYDSLFNANSPLISETYTLLIKSPPKRALCWYKFNSCYR